MQTEKTLNFIEKARKIHGDKYNYSSVEYVNSKTPIIIICPIHGEFHQIPNTHLSGRNCFKCSGTPKKTTEQFIQESIKIHRNFFDYSKVEYKTAVIKVNITCPIHGVFQQTPNKHLSGKGCPYCIGRGVTESEFVKRAISKHGNRYDYSNLNFTFVSNPVNIGCHIHGVFSQTAARHLKGCGCPTCAGKNKTLDTFIQESKETHKNTNGYSKYDYSKFIYVNAKTKGIIICPIHGAFKLTPNQHLSKKTGCPKCSGILVRNTEDFISEANNRHQYNYKYDRSIYVSANTPILIRCSKHGLFSQLPTTHIRGSGCPTCFKEKHIQRHTREQFIHDAKLQHGDIYDYSKVKYISSEFSVRVICKKHGEFLVPPSAHKSGRGCPKCNYSRGERKILTWLDTNNILFIPQCKFERCRNKRKLPFDFYIPEKNLIIEYDGVQHFKPIKRFGDIVNFKETQRIDAIKTKFCETHGILLLRIPYTEFKNIHNILEKTLNN